MIETDKWPMVPAEFFTPTTGRTVRLIVIHDMEYPERDTAAEDIARYFAKPRDKQGRPVKASAHVCIDNNSVVQCVRDRDIAYAAPGCNADGIQLELAGYAAQTAGQWDDVYSRDLLNMAAHVTAQYAVKFNIPVRHLTNAELQRGDAGIIGHYQASQVYKKSTHRDPGPNFPWDRFIAQTLLYEVARRART